MRRTARFIALFLLLFPSLFSARAETDRLPAFTLTRTLSCEYVEPGEWISLSYTMRNNSEYPISAITLTDSLVGEIVRIERLDAGISYTVVRRARVTNDTESAPSARFALGGRMHTIAIDPAPIRVERVALTAELKFESREEDAVVLRITNDGSAPVYTVKARDDALGDMGEAVERLDPGETVSLRRAARGGRHQCIVTAVGASGKPVSIRSNELVSGHASIPPATNEQPRLSAGRHDGQVYLTLYNPTAQILRDVSLRELVRGDGQTLRFVPADSSASVLWTPSGNPSGAYAFEAVIGDDVCLTASLPAAEPGDADPTPAPIDAAQGVPAANGPSFRMDEGPETYRQMLYVTAAALFVFLVAWWIIYRRRKRMARKKRLRQRQESRKKQQNKRNGEKAS